eukprot:c23145_g1_i1 orf=80-2626(+)
MPPSIRRQSISFHVLPRESSGDGELLFAPSDDKIVSAGDGHPRRRRRNKSRKRNLSQASVDIGLGLGRCLLEEEGFDAGAKSTVSTPGGSAGSVIHHPFRQDSFGSQEWDSMHSASRNSDSITVASGLSQLSSSCSVGSVIHQPFRQDSFESQEWESMHSASRNSDSIAVASGPSQSLSSCSLPLLHNQEDLGNGSHCSHSNGLQEPFRGQTEALGNQACKLDYMGNGALKKVTQCSMEGNHVRDDHRHSGDFVQSFSQQHDKNDEIAVTKSQQEQIRITETSSSLSDGVADYAILLGSTTHQISSSRADDAHTTSSNKEDLLSPDVQVFVEDGSSASASQLSRPELRQRIAHTLADDVSQPATHQVDEVPVESKDFGASSNSKASECGVRTETRDGHAAGQDYRTPEKPIHVPVKHTETPHLVDWEQLMSANSLCESQPVIASPLEYFLGEVLRPPSILQETQSAETDKKREHVYNTMFHVPWRCELLIVVGFFACLDSFLSLLTVTPVRIVVFLWRFFAKRRQFGRLRADELSDLGSLLVLMAGVTLLQQADISYIYHMIRSQATIKLYVVYNVLEIFDKLCQSFGSDVLQVVLNSAENVATCPNASLLSGTLQFVFDQCIAIFSFVFHSFVILAQSITVSAAIRSHNNALLTLLISNNFAEIKSNVFKRLAKDNLHKLAYLDTVERFHIIAHLFFVLAQNLLAANEPWLYAFACNAGMVFLCEVLVDVIKHAFLAKFNEIKPAAYSEFLLALCKQTLNSQSHELHKTMSFVPFAPACVVIRVLIPLYAAYLPGALLWRLLVMLLFGVLTYVFLIALKILVALALLRHASWYVARHKKKEKLLHFD